MSKPSSGGKLIIAGLVVGIIAAAVIYNWALEQQKTSKENWQPVVTALVEIKRGEQFTREKIISTPTPPDMIAVGAMTRIEDVEGKVSLVALRQKDQIHAADIVSSDKYRDLANKVPLGMRAIALEANEVNAVGTGIKPGNHVDVVATFHDQHAKQDVARIILQNALVVSINQADTDPGAEKGATTSLAVVVKPEQTELLTAAIRDGRAHLTLRHEGDNEAVVTTGISLTDLAEPKAPEMAKEPEKPRDKPVPIRTVSLPRGSRGVTLLRGVTETQVSFLE